MGPANLRLNPVGVAIIIGTTLCLILYAVGLPEWFSNMNKPNVSLRELLSASIHLAERGGERVKQVREKNDLSGKTKGLTKEGKKEMVTNGDQQSHEAIVYGMSKAFPGLTIISEETDVTPVEYSQIKDVLKTHPEVDKIVRVDEKVPMGQIRVWVDPLDATQEYTENLKEYVTVMVCVAVNGIPAIGVIHKPFTKETFWAWSGYGHSDNLQVATHKSNLSEHPKYSFIVSRSHQGDVEKVAKTTYGNSTIVIPAGGAGYKTLEVVKGTADAYLHTTIIKKWDICAGNAILSAFKGKMTTLDGKYIDYSSNREVKNENGLLATIYGHYGFLEKLSELTKKGYNKNV